MSKGPEFSGINLPSTWRLKKIRYSLCGSICQRTGQPLFGERKESLLHIAGENRINEIYSFPAIDWFAKQKKEEKQENAI
jgi:hypothetical protein